MRKLFDIASDLLILLDRIEEDEGELTSESEAALDSLGGEFADKVEGILRYRREVELDVEKFKAEEGRLRCRRMTLERTKHSLTEFVRHGMIAIDKTRLEAGTFKVSRVASNPSIIIENPETLPARFVMAEIPLTAIPANKRKEVISIMPRKREILLMLKQGVEVPGALLHRGEHLRVK